MVVVAMGEQDGLHLAATDCLRDGLRVVRGVDHDALGVVAHNPDVVVDVPRAAVQGERPRGDDAVNPDTAGFEDQGLCRHSSTTERRTEPECIFSNASSMSLMP